MSTSRSGGSEFFARGLGTTEFRPRARGRKTGDRLRRRAERRRQLKQREDEDESDEAIFSQGRPPLRFSAVPALPPPTMIGEGITMYMQMGGNAGDGATLARQTGAAQAAAAFGVDLKEQFSAWAPETMINQFKEAVAANPTCIEIMGHPGSTAFHDLVKSAVDQGIVVTSGNSPMTDLQSEFGSKGFGYAGVDLYVGGQITANYMLAQGLKSGDEAMVYGVFSQAERGLSEKGLADTLEKAGLTVDRLEITQEANSDATLAVPVLAAYVQAHPNLKAIGTQHGGVTSVLADSAEEGRQEAGRHHRRRYRPRSGDDRRLEVGLRFRDARPAPLSAGLPARPAVRDDGEIQDAGPRRSTPAPAPSRRRSIDALVDLIDQGIR